MNTSTPALSTRPAPIGRICAIHTHHIAGEPGETVESSEFVQAMRGAATGVNIVTTDGPAGRFGLTVSAFASVSAEPPLLLVCINRRSPACSALRQNRRFCVNVLAAAQQPIADTFAGRPATGNAYDFGTGTWKRSATGSPVLSGSTAIFDCSLYRCLDAGTHAIFIGAVRTVDGTDNCPLLYTGGAKRRPPIQPRPP